MSTTRRSPNHRESRQYLRFSSLNNHSPHLWLQENAYAARMERHKSQYLTDVLTIQAHTT